MIEAKRTLLIQYKRKINANRTLLIHELKKIKVKQTRLIPEKGKIGVKKKTNRIEVKQIEAVFLNFYRAQESIPRNLSRRLMP